MKYLKSASFLLIPCRRQVGFFCTPNLNASFMFAGSDSHDVTRCCICRKEARSHKCQSCDQICHPFAPCGTPIEEGYGGHVLCSRCEKLQSRHSLNELLNSRQETQVIFLRYLSDFHCKYSGTKNLI